MKTYSRMYERSSHINSLSQVKIKAKNRMFDQLSLAPTWQYILSHMLVRRNERPCSSAAQQIIGKSSSKDSQLVDICFHMFAVDDEFCRRFPIARPTRSRTVEHNGYLSQKASQQPDSSHSVTWSVLSAALNVASSLHDDASLVSSITHASPRSCYHD